MYLAIRSRLRHFLEGKPSGYENRQSDSILRNVYHLFQLFHGFVRMYLAVDIRLHQRLPYKVSFQHCKELGTIMDMLCHHILSVHEEVCNCLEVGSRSRQFLLGKTSRWEHT